MKIAICSTDRSPEAITSNRFGRAEYFAIYDDRTGSWQYIDNQQDVQAAQGAGIQAAQYVIDSGATVLLALNVGPKAVRALQANNVKIFMSVASLAICEVVELYTQGKLQEIEHANVEGHW